MSKDEIPSEVAKLIQAVGNYYESNENYQKVIEAEQENEGEDTVKRK